MSDTPDLQGAEEPWHNWRPIAAYAYILICIFDFIVMPSLVFYQNKTTRDLLMEARITDKVYALDVTKSTVLKEWEPVTLEGGGLFHVSFGAILTGAAVTGGLVRREMVSNGKTNGNGSS